MKKKSIRSEARAVVNKISRVNLRGEPVIQMTLKTVPTAVMSGM